QSEHSSCCSYEACIGLGPSRDTVRRDVTFETLGMAALQRLLVQAGARHSHEPEERRHAAHADDGLLVRCVKLCAHLACYELLKPGVGAVQGLSRRIRNPRKSVNTYPE